MVLSATCRNAFDSAISGATRRSARGFGLARTSAPARSFEPVVVYSLGVNPLLSTCPSPRALSPSVARAESRGDALSRIESGRAAPSGAERDRAPGSSGAEGPAVVATRASSTTPPKRVCACVRALSAYYSLRSSSVSTVRPREQARRRFRAPSASRRYLRSRVCTPRPFRVARARAWTTRAHEPTRI